MFALRSTIYCFFPTEELIKAQEDDRGDGSYLGRQPDVLEAVSHGGVGGVEGGGVARRVGQGAHCRGGQLSPVQRMRSKQD